MISIGRRPEVTVGIPFFNEEQHLAFAVRTILRQTLADLEILLVDDGSTDRSLEIARSFDDPRVTVRSDGQRRHLAARLNEIARQARGRYIARMDADDLAHPERLERQIAVLRRDERYQAVGTWAGIIDEAREPLAITEAHLPVTRRRALTHGVLPHATLVARREWTLAHPYDESLTRAEDRELWFRTVATTRYTILPEPLYVIRVLSHDPHFLPKYLAAQRENRRLFRRYGSEVMSPFSVLGIGLGSYARSLAMRVAVATNLTAPIVRRRGRPPTPGEIAMIQAAIGAARP